MKLKECVICGRHVHQEKDLCSYHQQALDNLKDTFEKWKKALDIEWMDYLNRLSQLEELGLWVREVIDYIK